MTLQIQDGPDGFVSEISWFYLDQPQREPDRTTEHLSIRIGTGSDPETSLEPDLCQRSGSRSSEDDLEPDDQII